MCNRFSSYEEFLTLFPEKPRQKAGNGWLVLCPAHADHDPSLWVRPSDNPDFIATWDCQAGSCTREDVLKALNLSWSDATRNNKDQSSKRSSISGKVRRRVDGTAKQDKKANDDPSSTNRGGTDGENKGGGNGSCSSNGSDAGSGVTLARIAEYKKLPIQFLRSLGLSDFKYNTLSSVRIPYYRQDGTEIAVRYRTALTGDRFRWRKGDHPSPYGLQNLEKIRQAGWSRGNRIAGQVHFSICLY
jgi:hypothetical protein